MTRENWTLVFIGVVVVALAAVFGWRSHLRSLAVLDAIPSRPPLAGLPAELKSRVILAETRARRGSVESLGELATLYQANGFLAESEHCLQALIELQPQVARWSSRLASLRADGDEHDPAGEELLDDCYDVFRLSAGAHLAERRGDPAAARTLLERARRLAPNDASVLLQLGKLCRKVGDAAAARSALEQATQADPTQAEAWAQLVELHLSSNDAASAARALAAGLVHCPGAPELRLLRARQLAADGQHDAAVAAFRETFQTRVGDGSPFINVAATELGRGDAPAGMIELRHSLIVEPEHPVALVTLALYSIGIGDAAGARDWLRRCHLESRVPPESLARIDAQYEQRFGKPFSSNLSFQSSLP